MENGQSLGAFRSVLPTVLFSFAAQTQLGLKNDLRSQAKQSAPGVAVAPHASRQALLGQGSDDTRHAEQIHDRLRVPGARSYHFDRRRCEACSVGIVIFISANHFLGMLASWRLGCHAFEQAVRQSNDRRHGRTR
jgi:hypothetical protein